MSANAGEIAFVSLGSNLGESADIVRRAFVRLQTLSDEPLLHSSLWRTTPVDCPPGSPLFVNAVAGLRPRAQETPQSLLRQLQELETEFGRQRSHIHNEPRPLDLDLITFGTRIVHEPDLILPHPRAHLRKFVLQPLAEIAPQLVLPGHHENVLSMLSTLSSIELVMRLD